MEKLQDKIEDIISGSVACENCNTPSGHKLVIKEIIEAVKERDKYIIGGDHFIYEGATYNGNKKAVNLVKGSQRQRAEESR